MTIKNKIIAATHVAISEASPCFLFRMSILNNTVTLPLLQNGPKFPIQDGINECLKSQMRKRKI